MHFSAHWCLSASLLLAAAANSQTNPMLPENKSGSSIRGSETRFSGVRYTADYDWSFKPSADLSGPGPKTLSLDACPWGVNAHETEYWIYISGTGVAEASRVTGGTCAGDAKPGTLLITTLNPHSSGYMVGSASSGLQEASVAARVQPSDPRWLPEAGKVMVSPGSDLQIHARVSIRASYQTIDFSGSVFDCQLDDVCIFVGDPAKSTMFRQITLIAPSGRPGLPAGTRPMIETNAQVTRIVNVSAQPSLNHGTFGSYVQVDDDQAFLLDGLDSIAANVRCDDTFCGSYVTAPGPFNKWSAVGWLKNMNVSPGCKGNAVDWQSGNTLRISDSVIQGYKQFGVRTGLAHGGYGGSELDNVYMEVGVCGKPYGAAGAIAQGGSLVIKSERNPVGEVPSFQNLGNTYYAYFVVLSHATFGDSMPLAMGWAKTDGSTPVEVSWPVVRGITGAGRYKLLRMAWDGKGQKPMPLGSGNWLIATLDPAMCNATRCKFTDSHAAAKPFTTVATLGGSTVYFPALDFWPGNVVLSSPSDTQNLSAPAKLFADFAALDGVVSIARYVDGPVVFATYCSYGSGGYAATTVPPRQCLDPGAPTYQLKRALVLENKSPLDGGQFTNYKGRLNFLTLGSGPSPLITWEDSSPLKTLAHSLNRPPAEPADSDSGMVSSGVQYTRANLEIRNYVGALPDKNNWKERLTSKDKSFAVPVNIIPGNTLTLGSGSPLSQLKMFSTKAIDRRAVPQQSCIDVAGLVPGLTANDMVTAIKPPGSLGNLSLTGYAVAADSVNLHFCNASSALANTPAGSYSFLAVH